MFRNLIFHLYLPLLLFLALTSCNEEEVTIEKNLQTDQASRSSEKGQTLQNAKTNVVNIGAYVSSPVSNGKIVLERDGNTTVRWTVTIRRSSTSEDINQQFILTNGFPWSSTYGSSIYIRTVDMGNSLEKTFTASANVTGSPSKISIISRNFSTTPATDFEAASYSTTFPTLDIGEIVGVSSFCRYRNLDGDRIGWNFSAWGVNFIRDAYYSWSASSNLRIRNGPEGYGFSNVSIAAADNAPSSFTGTITVTVSKPGFETVTKSKTVRVDNCTIFVND